MSLNRFFAAPARIAQTLNWRKSTGKVVTLGITKTAIDVVVASHPLLRESLLEHIPSIPLSTHVEGNRRVIDDSVLQKLSAVVAKHQHDICGMVVSWPVQEEGWCGAPCGRVLRTLDQLADQSGHLTILSAKRPLCLWDYQHHGQAVDPEDSWGRAECYSHASDKKEHRASLEQYQDPPQSSRAALVWEDYCRVHWPELFQTTELVVPAAQSRPSLVQVKKGLSRTATPTKRPSRWSTDSAEGYLAAA